MATFGENDVLTVVSTLRRFGLSMLDGEHYLFPAHWPESRKRPPSTPEQALQEGVPYLRFSNSFVKQWRGAQWLKQSRPNNPGFNRILETTEPPASYAMLVQAKETRRLVDVPSGYVPLTQGPQGFHYQIVPDRDLNGAGLLYFANYPTFLDIAERQILSTGAELTLDDSLLDRRTLVHRRSAYMSNATANDVLQIKLEAWIENPFLAGHLDPATAPIRLFLNYEMRRQSDQRLMLVSAARKVVVGQTLGATKLLDSMRARVE
jgi:probable biosynthetic protein (TIGR04098 family)